MSANMQTQLRYYTLNEKKEVVPCDLLGMCALFDCANSSRIVDQTRIGEATVSTVFLAIDHGFQCGGDPVLWETMIFGGPHDQYQTRCSGTWADAEEMHKDTVKALKRGTLK